MREDPGTKSGLKQTDESLHALVRATKIMREALEAAGYEVEQVDEVFSDQRILGTVVDGYDISIEIARTLMSP